MAAYSRCERYQAYPAYLALNRRPMLSRHVVHLLPTAGVALAYPSNGTSPPSHSYFVPAALPPRIQKEDVQCTAVLSLSLKCDSSASKDCSWRPVLRSPTSITRFGSLSRVLLVGQPGSMFRTLANRKWPSSVGPISLLVFLFGTVLALIAAIRGALVRKVKACKCCKGFGVVRCRLCNGRGTVDWRAKFSYSETCPLCAARRFVVCPDCGGHYHRRLFNHSKGLKGTLEAYFPMTAPSGGPRARFSPLD
uniref:MTF1484 n=1 Tax=Volvox carteri f. nagariensis TaxID=3068 RepID=D9CJ06_VOLCA|nr:MTF1484 [Volvox carteri f. nagariensis]